MRVEREGAAAWLLGTLEVPRVQGHGLPLLQELWPYQSLFSFFDFFFPQLFLLVGG